MTISRGRKWGIVLTLAVLCGIIVGESIPQGGRAVVGEQPVREIDPDSMIALVGANEPIARDANPMVASVAEALRSGDHPERLSAMVVPAEFDQRAFNENPNAYLNTVEPGRVWQPAQPREGVPQARAISPEHVEVLQGEPIALKVQAVPGAPVTFTSFDLGAFSNRLTSITVAADQEGIAVANYTGTPGTFNENNILAASPLTSGQVRFSVFVVVPKLRERQAAMLGR